MSDLLVTNSEKFLKEIQSNPVIAERIEDFESFSEIYSYLKNNIIELEDLRNKMEIKGYTSPYGSMKRFSKSGNNAEIIPDDVHDQSRHAQYFRIKASYKKNTLDQVKTAIASHKIAIGHIEEYSRIICEDCGTNYTTSGIEDILLKDDDEKIIGYKCSCGRDKFDYIPNHEAISRLGIIKYLPLGGEYLLKRSQLTNYSLEAYRKLIKIMRQEKRGIVKSITVIAKIRDEETGRWSTKKMNLDYADESKYELELRKKYGSNNVRIELFQIHHNKPALLNDQYAQNALAIAYVQYSEHIVNNDIDDIVRQHIHNMDKIDTYKNIKQESHRDASRLARQAEERIELEEELNYINLKKHNLINKDHSLDRELSEDLKREGQIKKHFYIETPKTMLLWDIFKYYLTTNENRRINYPGSFPNLRPSIDSNQMKVFDEPFNKDIVKLLQNNDENIDVIPNMKETLQYNMELENKCKKLHIKSNHAARGAICLNSKADISLNRAAKLLYVDIDDVTKEKESLRKIEKPSTNKAKKFLEIINK
ncbi:MAG: DUF530 domain-containing protein [Methanosphaera sp.]|nr:DUF530 domain-containing protein [Methanosphaera sp.]